ncbi:DUF2971 domain-containing protein [Runella aurantiaca]|uniref:DUF2971 domain-containing protein n=1 Tax=Runella aurantiaca TaxID=2282308 RepID=A0A369I7B5_9BACT|nr:DUF2971 domain-containing protein [Runella aurantiaca]RDB04387.1 DUF2971 domain-containing protein [Runella aurantiaca]
MRIFKYLAPERIDVLKNQTLRFTQANYLNDPFENLPFISKVMDEGYNNKFQEEYLNPALQQAMSLQLTAELLPPDVRGMLPDEQWNEILSAYPMDQVFEMMPSLHPSNLFGALMNQMNESDPTTLLKESFNKQFGVLSLTRRNANLTMWSHYTNSHTGYVIEFDPSNHYFNKTINENDRLRKLNDIIYVDERPNVTLFDSNFEEDKLIDHMVEKILLTKSKHWEYEEELRMIQPLNESDIQINNGDIHLFKFDAQAVKSVYFGVNASPEFKDNVLQLLSDLKYQHVDVYQGELSKSEYKVLFQKVK